MPKRAVRFFYLSVLTCCLISMSACKNSDDPIVTDTSNPTDSESPVRNPAVINNYGFTEELKAQVNFLEVLVVPAGSIVSFEISIPTKNVLPNYSRELGPIDAEVQFLNFHTKNDNSFHEKHPNYNYKVMPEKDNVVVVGKTLLNQIPIVGRMQVHISLKVDTQETFKGIFDLGPTNDLKKSVAAPLIKSAIQLQNVPLVIDFISQNSMSSLFENNQDSLHRPLNQYIFTNMSFKFKGLDRNVENSTNRSVKIGISACVKEPLFFNAVKLKRFKIKTYKKIENPSDYFSDNFEKNFDKSLTTLPTDPVNGCFDYTDQLSFDWYTTQRLYIKPYKVVDTQTNSESTIASVVNPWNTGWIFAQDIRKVDETEIFERSNIKPETLIQRVKMDAVSVRYDVDKSLKLKLIKKYNLELHPLVTRFDSLAVGSFGSSSLKGGFYLLNIALVRKVNGSTYTPENYISSWQKVVPVKNGVILSDFEISVSDLTLMGNRNSLLVQVMPINESEITFTDESLKETPINQVVDQKATLSNPKLIMRKSNLVSNTFEGPFVPLHLHQSPTLINSSVDAEDYIRRGKKRYSELFAQYVDAMNMQMFDNHFRLKPLMLSNEKDILWLQQSGRINSEDLEYLLPEVVKNPDYKPKLHKTLQYKLCHLWSDVFLPEQIKKYNKTSPQGEQLTRSEVTKVSSVFKKNCLNHTKQNAPFFQFDQKVLINDVDPNNQIYMGGVSFNFGVGSNFSLNKSSSREMRKTQSNTVSFSAGMKEEFIPFVDVGLSLSESLSSNSSEGHGMGTSSNLAYNFGAYLVIQNSRIRLNVTDYQQCLVVTPNSLSVKAMLDSPINRLVNIKELYNKIKVDPITDDLHVTDQYIEEFKSRKLRSFITKQQKLDLFESGIRICNERIKNLPLQITESYYYITQHFLAGDMHDPHDLKNRPWLMSIRSNRDFRVFIEAVRNHNRLQQVGDINHMPIQTLMEAYTAYNSALPSWPSVITMEKNFPIDSKRCESEVSFEQRLYSSITDFFKGPVSFQSGTTPIFEGINFWDVYYCPNTQQRSY